MTSTTEQAPIALLRSAETERRMRRLVHPRVAVVLVPGGVVGIGALLYLWWPAGVLVGCVACTVAVLAVGTVMQRAERSAPVAEDLVALLGGPRRPARVTEPAEVAPTVSDSLAGPVAPIGPVTVAEPVAPTASVIVAEPVAPTEPPVVTDLIAIERAAVEQHEAEEQALLPVRATLADRDPERARLKAELGDDFADFARAARLVVQTQYASAARLQRELGLPWARARRLIEDLETEQVVGPASGSLPRQVMVPRDRLDELDRILA